MYKRDDDPNVYSRFEIMIYGINKGIYLQRLYELDSYISEAGISHTYVYSAPIYGGQVLFDKSKVIFYKVSSAIWYQEDFDKNKDLVEIYLQDASPIVYKSHQEVNDTEIRTQDLLLQSLDIYTRYPDTLLHGLQQFGALLALLRLSIFFALFHEKRHERVLERKFAHYHHTVAPLEIEADDEPKSPNAFDQLANQCPQFNTSLQGENSCNNDDELTKLSFFNSGKSEYKSALRNFTNEQQKGKMNAHISSLDIAKMTFTRAFIQDINRDKDEEKIRFNDLYDAANAPLLTATYKATFKKRKSVINEENEDEEENEECKEDDNEPQSLGIKELFSFENIARMHREIEQLKDVVRELRSEFKQVPKLRQENKELRELVNQLMSQINQSNKKRQ